VILALRLVPESKNPTAVQMLDLPGVGLISASLFCLTFALVEGQKYGWTSGTILGLFAGAAVAFALFYWREHCVSQPLSDFSLFRTLNFAAPLAGVLSYRLGSKWIVAAGAVHHLGNRHRSRGRPGHVGRDGDGAQGARRQRLGRAVDDASGRQPHGHRRPRAVLQNRVTANITEGIQAVQGIPEAVKQKIIAGAGSGAMQMGIPQGSSNMPLTATAMMETMFKGWFTDAVATTFIVAVILAVSGGLCAFLLRRNAKEARVATEADAPAGPAGDVAVAQAGDA
ncbi:MAG TPA: hypothetical protein VIK32_07215, partial [Candidatus Limnocylindrales bacterium]